MKSALEAEVRHALSQGGRILITRLQHLGDVVLSLPLVAAVRQQYPRAEIDYLSRGAGAEILAREPGFARIFRVPEKRDGRLEMLRFIRALRRRRYRAVIDLYSNPRSALLSRLTGAPLRVGGARRGRRHFYTHATRVPPEVRSASEHHLCFAAPLAVNGRPGKPQLHISEAERARAEDTLVALGARGDTPRIGIHPGGKWEVKRWPAASFARLAARLASHHGFEVVVLWGPGEEVYAQVLRDALGNEVRYLSPLPLREMAAVLQALDGFVVSDGGAMHVAVAVGTSTVGIFGSSEPDIWFPYERFGPYASAYAPITCRPCHSHLCDHISCLHWVTVDRVEQQLLEVLTRSRALR